MKIAQISPILEKLNEKFAGQAGVLHLENYETSGTSVRFVPEKAAETEADEGQDAGQTDENQSGESEAAQTDQTSAAGTGEGETTEIKKHKIHKNLLIICVKDYIIYLLNSIVHTYL